MDVTGIITDIIVIIAGISAAYIGIKKWVKRQVDTTEKIKEEIRTTNGHTIGEMTESNHNKLEEVAKLAQTNSTLLTEVFRWRDEHVHNHP